jgi:hypothetical protein
MDSSQKDNNNIENMTTQLFQKEEEVDVYNTYHKLISTWVLWYHTPSNPDWSINGYHKICEFKYAEDVVKIIPLIPENIITNCCLFFMKKGIDPIWEDKSNCNGGAFSYRITNKFVLETFRDLSFVVAGETTGSSRLFNDKVNGITISPKKNFCVLKIWMRNSDFQNPAVITNDIKNLVASTALFKIHDEKKTGGL